MHFASRVIISKGERVLLGLRSSKTEKGKWNIIGGKIDAGEDLHSAASREVKEEIGFLLEKLEYIFTDTFGEWISHYFIASLPADAEVVPDTEHSVLSLFTRAEIEAMESQIAFNHYLILRRYFDIKRAF